jgi:hypothetical protein
MAESIAARFACEEPVDLGLDPEKKGSSDTSSKPIYWIDFIYFIYLI